MPLSSRALVTFAKLGVLEIFDQYIETDPTTEEEFLKIEYPTKPSVSWKEYIATYEQTKNKSQPILLRKYRQHLLNDCDWVMTADVFTSLANKDEWITYRQKLRNLPETLTNYVWKDNETLDFAHMDIPVAPPLIRTQPYASE